MTKHKKEEKVEEILKEILEEQENIEEAEKAETEPEAEEKVEEAKTKEETIEDEDMKTQLLRLQADFANFKKRSEREKQDIYKYAAEGVLADLLGTLDNFDRAFTAIEPQVEESGFCQGMKMIQGQLVEILQKHGLAEIKSVDEEFDPNIHHAVMQVEVEDVDSNKVVEVFQKGYKVKDKVLRPAMVKVSK